MILQTIPLEETTVKTRWLEPYVTAGLNQKALAGDARGVVLGFRVVPNVNYTVSVQTDPILGLSIANVVDTTTEKYSVTVVQSSDVAFDLIAYAGTTVYVVLAAQYKIGNTSGAQILVVDAAEFGLNPDLITLAKVVVPVSPPIVTTSINMGYRLSAGDSTPPDALPPFNALVNGTFERDTAGAVPLGWKALSGASLSPTVDATVFRPGGTQSLRLSSVGAVTGSFGTNFVAVEPGQFIRASLWIRSSGGSPVTGTGVTTTVEWFSPAYASLSSVQLENSFTGGSTIFEQRQAEVTAPAGAAFAKIAVNYVSCSGTLYVDDVQFLVRSGEALARSAVFAGNNSVADQYHAHAAAGLNYAGSLPSQWADLTNLPSGTVEDALDGVVIAVGGTSGAAKVGYTPATPLDLSGVTRVDQALNTLDDLKAGINLNNTFTGTNTFTKTNTFTPSVPNSSGIIVSANGTFPAIAASADPANSGAAITASAAAGSTATAAIIAAGGGTNGGVSAVATGTGPGVLGQSFTGVGVRGVALLSTNPGVQGQGFSSGSGVSGTGGTSGPGVVGTGQGAGAGVSGTGGSTGPGGVFQGGASHHGLVTTGGGTLAGAFGIDATGGNNNGVGVRGTGKGSNYGVQGVGGPTSGIGVYGLGGTTNGVGVFGQATGSAVGVQGHSPSGIGVYGSSSSASGPGGSFQGGTNGPGLYSEGQGTGTGVIGFGNGAFTTPPASTGVYGRGIVGVIGTSNDSGSGADGVQGTGGPDGNGGTFITDPNDTVNGSCGVHGTFNGVFTGYGIKGITTGFGAGVRGEASDNGARAIEGVHGGNNAGIYGTGGIGGWFQTSSTDAIRSDGYINMHNGANPAPSTGFKNYITKASVVKAWACLSFTQAGTIYLVRGFNVSGVGANSTGNYYITFAQGIGEPERYVPSTNITVAGANPTWTITVAAGGFTANDVGNSIRFGGLNAANNGDFRILSYISSTSITIQNTAGLAEGPIAAASWIIFQGEGVAHVSHDDSYAGGANRSEVWISSLRPGSCNFQFRRHDTGAAIDLANQVRVYVTVLGIQY